MSTGPTEAKYLNVESAGNTKPERETGTSDMSGVSPSQ
jgi:hypothetical protein